MYKIKQKPEDFIVKEISTVKPQKQGRYTYFWLKKKEYTTLDAMEKIAAQLRIPVKKLGFAGNKDKNAVTEQMCSAEGVAESRLNTIKLKDIEVSYAGKGNLPISLGDLEGNEFAIVVRNIDSEPKLSTHFVNYFGEQRFSKNNALVGKAIVKKDFKKAVELVLEGKGKTEHNVKKYLDANPNNYVGALKCIQKKMLKMYIHAYQSLLWNKRAEKFKEEHIPIVGFNTQIDKKIMDEERITMRDFIIKQIPELSAEGGFRERTAEAKNLSMSELKEDELNPRKKKVLIKFMLPKGSYATEYIRQLFNISKN